MFKNIKRHLAYWAEDPVEPNPGCVVYCKLAGNAEHTGIFIGGGRGIVELDGNGNVREVTPQEFLNGPSGIRASGIAIYVSCDEEGDPLSNSMVYYRAKKMIGTTRNYSLAMDNCHQFTCGCLSGDFENSDNFFWMMEEQVKKHLNNGKDITWRNWNYDEYITY